MAIAASLVASGAVLGGCAAYKNFQRTIVVKFKADSTDDMRNTVRTACGPLPGVSPAPIPPTGSAAARAGDVTFVVTKANNKELADLYACLTGKPGVVGAVEPEGN